MITKAIPMRDALLESIWQKMAVNKKIFFASADFGSPILDRIRSDFPKRFVNVGIAEQNLINVSAGLALEGYAVFAYAIAPFITMRCYEQTRVSLALLSEVRPMNVNLIGVGAGYSYVVSGPTHQCYEDITLMRAMPNVRFLSPADHITSAAMLDTCINNIGPKYLRLDAQVLPVIYQDASEAISRGYSVHQSGRDICIIATGYMLHTAFKVVKELEAVGYSVGLIDLIDLTFFDRAAFLEEINSYSLLVSMEEGFKARGGLDALIFNLLSCFQSPAKLLNIGVEGGYRFELGTRSELHEQVGIGAQIALEKIKVFLGYYLKRDK
jgi:transketolase